MQHEPIIARVALELSPDDITAIALETATIIRDAMHLTDDALRPLNREETAKLLGTTTDTLVSLERRGVLVPFCSEGRYIRYSRQQIAAWQAGQK